MKSLFDTIAHQELLDRINKLNKNSKANWGKMTVGQVMRHCQFPLNLALGKESIPEPNPIMKFMFKGFKKSMYNDKPWKHNLPTVKQFKVVEDHDFDEAKQALIELVNKFHEEKTRTTWEPHPSFGSFTPEQWGQMQYKHLDHHLRQFGV
ncbi:MAG: DUF1569 domain-containing protein [Croceitalea sp.]|nr:DUF1569 domain-containing protein [Croceitalea sp.]MBT8238269.1 DUF1569 domain-containing protein [Croceitalea sp.]NNC33364.1 DUF1569 domain-containing protein [Croceitalea sp.]NNL09299.1 DUF1569 domain-containing protein [Croceitalea sp.]NNM19288.1 DUF1569 domain-containing protein [Croceitalea sp.]